ncbi:MAG: hypothetical protein NXI32_26220 [bacterium]|nr:hypothetical protein [bacterium]
MSDPLAVLQPAERRGIALLFCYGFGNAAAYVLARTVADSAFLSRFGSDRLPELYMLSAGVVALSSVAYARCLPKWGLRATVVVTLMLFSLLSVALPAFMQSFPGSLVVLATSYLLAQIRGSLGTIQYATLLNEVFHGRRPERIVGLAGAGATLAGISMGIGIGVVSPNIPISWLLYAAAAIDLLTMLPLLALSAKRSLDADGNLQSGNHALDANAEWERRRSKPAAESATSIRILPASGYVRYIALTVTFCILATTFVEYQWKVTAAEVLDRDSGQLARYFGIFYAVVYLLTGMMQLLVTSSVLQKRGMLAGLLSYPMTLLATTLLAWVGSGSKFALPMITLCKGTDCLRRGLHDPTVQVLYSPLEKGARRKAITLVAGIAKPFAEAIAGFLLVVLSKQFSPEQMSPFVFATILLWLASSWRLWRWFRRTPKAA